MKDIIVDVGNTYIKISYFKKKLIIVKEFKSNIKNILEIKKYLKKINEKDSYFYFSFLNNKLKRELIQIIKNINNNFYIFKKKDLFEYVKVNNEIDKNEIGIDILSFCYLVQNYKKSLLLSFGTATVATIYNKKIEEIILFPNIDDSINLLLEKTSLKTKMNMSKSENKKNTKNSIINGKNILLNGIIKEILSKYKNIKEIYVTGGNKNDFNLIKLEKKYNTTIIDNATLLGFYKYINNKK